MNKLVKTAELFDCKVPYLQDLFAKSEYPWEMLPKIKALVAKLVESGIDGFTELEPGVLVGADVTIAPTATIIPPAIIGAGTEIRPGAYLRGNVITGANCVLGNSSEYKNCILLDTVKTPHYNYVGDSILGNRSHLGAGSICSNLKADESNVVIRGEENYETGLRKIGGILADGANLSCSCVVNPGVIVGRDTVVYPMTVLRGVYPADCIVKSQTEVVKKSETKGV